ncbi:putative nicotinate-nucleotide pyrophosphorylase [[Clostridium] cellulosi]|uniref:Probable nicotinate-nucleotide pyrophosphorylase [carboxylating] n=1 Tax=[Clostridium] cellulosi TaxID=29343 RepID=A0A078KMM9_9FIRM|nr:putative nicotinate-nucleotide pyrophosphorylase [[Clostridium] cellulosi]
MSLSNFSIDEIIIRALKEDINYVDVTTDYLIPEEQESTAAFFSKANGILCGIDVALRTFKLLDGDMSFEILKHDGDILEKSDVIARIHGKTRALLKGERTALNILQHMSGIATATNAAVREIAGTKASIADTRKTLPGLRMLEKYAVAVGGGRNHRFNLSDAAMIKDNHIDATGSITKAVETLRSKIGHTIKIEVETRNLDEVKEALASGADIIMLDNMDNDTMKKAVEIIGGKALVEASGGITAGNLKSVAETGVDIISVGALTHSVKAFDISMKII